MQLLQHGRLPSHLSFRPGRNEVIEFGSRAGSDGRDTDLDRTDTPSGSFGELSVGLRLQRECECGHRTLARDRHESVDMLDERKGVLETSGAQELSRGGAAARYQSGEIGRGGWGVNGSFGRSQFMLEEEGYSPSLADETS